MKWAILLTSCVRTNPARIDDTKYEYYIRSIKHWLENTNLPIYIVESSGYTFTEFKDTRLKVFSCNLTNLGSSSAYEAQSILLACDFFKEDFKKFTHIMKITARYCLDINDILPVIPDVDIILQHANNPNIKWNNSEIFGFRSGSNDFLELMKPSVKLMEIRIYDFSQTHTNYRLPPINNIYKVKRGGDGLIINPL